MKPMFLKEVENAAGGGSHALAIRQRRAAGLPIAQIMHLLAFKPDRTDPLVQFAQAVMRGPSPLSAGERELIAAFTSTRNHCLFCTGSHAAVAAELLGSRELVDAVLNDYITAPISEKMKAILAFVEKVTLDSSHIAQADVDAVKQADWSDEAIYDGITVCAMFNFFNRWVNASGVSDMPPTAYQIGGKRMATEGYVPPTT
jgi:uncharacterized peroxidase-related enzyme